MFVINALVWNVSQALSPVELSNTSHHVAEQAAAEPSSRHLLFMRPHKEDRSTTEGGRSQRQPSSPRVLVHSRFATPSVMQMGIHSGANVHISLP